MVKLSFKAKYTGFTSYMSDYIGVHQGGVKSVCQYSCYGFPTSKP